MAEPVFNAAEVRRRREAVGMTLQEAADRAGWPASGRQRWYDLESGRKADPQISTVVAVARALKCRIEDLLLEESATPAKAQKRSSPSGSAGSKT